MHAPPEKRRDPADRFVLRTLGSAFLSVVHPDGTSEVVLRPSKPLAVIIYLALASDHAATRDQLIELLWLHQKRPQALTGLRVALTTLRRELGNDILGPEEDPVTLRVAIESDRDALVAAWTRHEFETVVKMYDGHFFPNFATPGGAAFEQWADAERASLRKMFHQATAEVVHDRLSRAKTHDAELLANRVRDLDRGDEYAWHLLLECLLSSRNVLRGSVEAAELEHMLAADESEPDPLTRSLLHRLRTLTNGNGDTNDTRGPLAVELVGREREFSTILQAWDQARAGRAVHVYVTAPAGFGKTRLLDDVRARLRATDARVVHVSANQGARDLPYALASDICGALASRRGASGVASDVASALVALNPALSAIYHVAPDPTSGEEALRRREVALRELVCAVADDKPFALLIDDLHWSDALSLRMLEVLFASLERTPVLVLSAARHNRDAGHVASRAIQVTLEPLDTNDVVTLLASVAPLPDQPWASHLPEGLRRATNGSPLLVLETLQLLRERDLLVATPTGWSLHGNSQALFDALGERSALRRRVESLDGLQRSVLLLLAVAGVPVSEEQLRDAAGALGNVGASLAALEQRGLIAVHSREWSTAHDEHADAIINVASSAELGSAAAAMGRALADEAGRSVRQLRLAALLLARGNDVEALRALFARFERIMRSEGDSRLPLALVRDLLGGTATTELERTLVRALPWHVRVRLHSSRRAAVVTALVGVPLSIALAVFTIGARPQFAPEATLMLLRQSVDGTTEELVDIPLDAQRLASTSPIEIDADANAKHRIPLSAWRYVQSKAPRPDGQGWAATRAVGDSGVLDVFDLRLDGTSRRLTAARLDDIASSWSPDNRQLVFLTMRWSTHGHYNLAIYDTLTRGVRRLTGPHEDIDIGAHWSPDGSRIVFTRERATTNARHLCIIDADGSHLRCLPTPLDRNTGVLQWADAHRVFVQTPRLGKGALVRVDVDNGEETTVLSDHNGVEISPDGRYAFCTCTRRGYPAGTRFLFAVDAPDEMTVVRFTPSSSDGESRSTIMWSPSSPIQPYLTHLRVLAAPGLPVSGLPYQLRVEGIDNRGHPLDVGVVRWRSLDTTIATVDSAGMLHARDVGTVSVEASAGGWVSAVIRISVVAPTEPRSLLDERWEHSLDAAWIPFGQPQPTIVASERLGRAFSTNGDGSFWSGAFSKRAFETRHGMWVEAELSVTVTVPGPAQEQLVALFAVHDSVRWNTWDRVTGDYPAVPICRIRFPIGANHSGAGDSLTVESQVDAHNFAVPRRLRDGQPFRALIQILPDGRCGFAIDGQPIFISAPTFFDADARVMLVGNTQETHNLIGRVQVHTGIAPVKWADLENHAGTVGNKPSTDR